MTMHSTMVYPMASQTETKRLVAALFVVFLVCAAIIVLMGH